MPICILVYWLAERHARDLVRHWPFRDLEGDRNLVMVDMGEIGYSLVGVLSRSLNHTSHGKKLTR